MIVGLIGDLEGDCEWAVSRLRMLGERGDVRVAFHLGDLRFGMGPDHEAYLRPIQVTDHVWLLPRGHRWETGGRTFVALGGAPSVNRLRLTEGLTWWPTEVITEEHVASTIVGGHAEIMLTHDSPSPPYCTDVVADVMVNNPNGWPDSILAYAEDGIDKVTRAVIGVKPLLLVHGHFHVAGEAVVRLPESLHNTTVWSLGANGDPANVRLLDLDTLTDARTAG